MKECIFASEVPISDNKSLISCIRPEGCINNGKIIGIIDAVINPPKNEKGEPKWEPGSLEKDVKLYVEGNCPLNRKRR
jgi:hypothetical protein